MAGGHKYGGVHGHSFTARVTIAGTPDAATGFVVDLGALERACADLRAQLDHGYLNDIEGLALPSLENIAVWIWGRLILAYPGLTHVEVRRDSSGHGCSYSG